MHKSNPDQSGRHKFSRKIRSESVGEDKTRQAERRAGAHVWAVLRDAVTNVQPLVATSHVSEVSL